MSKSYFTEDQKLLRVKRIPWSWEAQDTIKSTLLEKGYSIDIVTRLGCDRQAHDAWQVSRDDVPQLVEQLFRQRLVAEFQAEGKGKAAIIFGYDFYESTIIDAVKKFQNKRE